MERYNTISITFIKDFANKKVGEVIECDCALARDLVIGKNAKYTEKEVVKQEEIKEKVQLIQPKKAKKDSKK